MAAATDTLAAVTADIQNLYREIEMLNESADYEDISSELSESSSSSSPGGVTHVSMSPDAEKSFAWSPPGGGTASKQLLHGKYYAVGGDVQHPSESVQIFVNLEDVSLPPTTTNACVSVLTTPDTTRPSMGDNRVRIGVARAATKKLSQLPTVRFCQVCNDYASGFHYGAWSCEGCKAFFKRSIQGPTDYVCPATNSCTIDKHRRKSCQACRLQKCLDVGMSRSAKPGARREVDRQLVRQRTLKRAAAAADGVVAGADEPTAAKIKREVPSCTNPLVQTMLECDYYIGLSGHDHSATLDETTMMATITKIADRELVFTINWVKHVPGYSDLPLNDQVGLLETTWFELMTHELCFRSMPLRGDKIVFAPDFVLDRSAMKVAGIEAIGGTLLAITRKFAELRLSREELICLKGLSLVSTCLKSHESGSRVQKIETSLLEALHEAIVINGCRDRFRMARLLLIISDVRYVATLGVAHLFQLKTEQTIPMLLQEMVTAQFIQQHALRKT
ncbi:PREDICTED: estrogen receptor beta-like [Priapulus caudatus]|uniref:Estrogen receptor beta-like n=1 Tax=Priapulus caudatus TaxID=37621 RepID=A0ABM1E855_PRICU|nr:PREDICTED: estrogen receptor beta-like [Priapulus caudatus]